MNFLKSHVSNNYPPGRQRSRPSQIIQFILLFVVLFFATSILLATQLERVDSNDSLHLTIGRARDVSSIVHSGNSKQASLPDADTVAPQQVNHKKGRKVYDDSHEEEKRKQLRRLKKFLHREVERRARKGIITLREAFEEDHPPNDMGRIKKAVYSNHWPNKLQSPVSATYDIYSCPYEPVDGYPMTWNSLEILEHWNPDDTDPPSDNTIYQGLCVFDWETEQNKVKHYRELELPFVVQNYPDVLRTSERWLTKSSNDREQSYLEELLGDESMEKIEYSNNNHFMYWRRPGNKKAAPVDWKPPTEHVSLSYMEWLQKAEALEQQTTSASDGHRHNGRDEYIDANMDQTTKEHWYFRVNGSFNEHPYLYDELPFFNPVFSMHKDEESCFMQVNHLEHRGINCRFGMKGVTAESHFDLSRNFIVLMGGQRRYILAHPNQCENMELYTSEHPSSRHSSVNWSTVVQEKQNGPDGHDRPFYHAQLNEVVLQAGDVLYLPTSWFHFIVSLNINYQCNARSGSESTNHHHLLKCGQLSQKKYERSLQVS